MIDMNTYEAVRERLLQLLEINNLSIHKLATESGVSPSTIKNILYGKSLNPGIVTLKMLCDGMAITIPEFFSAEVFSNLEPEIK